MPAQFPTSNGGLLSSQKLTAGESDSGKRITAFCCVTTAATAVAGAAVIMAK